MHISTHLHHKIIFSEQGIKNLHVDSKHTYGTEYKRDKANINRFPIRDLFSKKTETIIKSNIHREITYRLCCEDPQQISWLYFHQTVLWRAHMKKMHTSQGILLENHIWWPNFTAIKRDYKLYQVSTYSSN
jgi:hypothetical protein